MATTNGKPQQFYKRERQSKWSDDIKSEDFAEDIKCTFCKESMRKSNACTIVCKYNFLYNKKICVNPCRYGGKCHKKHMSNIPAGTPNVFIEHFGVVYKVIYFDSFHEEFRCIPAKAVKSDPSLMDHVMEQCCCVIIDARKSFADFKFVSEEYDPESEEYEY